MDNKFNQLCVWEGVTLGNDTIDNFEKFFLNNLNTKIKYCETVITKGSFERNEEGGRSDILFYVHDDDIQMFALKRFNYEGIRWWEDVVSYNDGAYKYDREILDKYPVRW